jgi:hypothetical protein
VSKSRCSHKRVGEMDGVKQRHVGALAKLWAGLVSGIADEDEAPAPGAAHSELGVASLRQLLVLRELLRQGCRLRPDRRDFAPPDSKVGFVPLVEFLIGHAPEEGVERCRVIRQAADRQHADQGPRGFVASCRALRTKPESCATPHTAP